MSIVRYRQWPAQAAFQNEMKQLFDRFFDQGGDTDESAVVTAQWVPRVDIKEEPERFVLFADLPGIDPADIEVSMDKGILSIKGERKSESTTDSERFSRVERRYGSFHRRFALPDSADPEQISASGRHGVLEVRIPKRPASTPRRIQVGTESVQ
ncbi:Hsp20/alpha crystallin family protein [Xanthomonas sp. AmX2]|uniref:Hsp20/alpha crystallin family protein n=1 Tax=Xanthomonas sp. TaxID=29446 RepID=UPI001980851A|nr:Hsp20/alpha crystallin family protein [Xanthomonas sp.]MBN6149336.1 Hsp20/alpha crystallin family protein [Xanthomonas sp.]